MIHKHISLNILYGFDLLFLTKATFTYLIKKSDMLILCFDFSKGFASICFYDNWPSNFFKIHRYLQKKFGVFANNSKAIWNFKNMGD